MDESGEEKRKVPSTVVRRLEELNGRIADLKRKDSPLMAVRSALTGKDPARVSLDYIDSEELYEIEKGIRETLDGITLSKAALCKALANIDRKRLYTQAGAESFLEYLELERLPVNYKTAKEYAKIGGMLIRHSEDLENIAFREEDGLKKLVYLDKALANHGEHREEVFDKVKHSSLREFQRFAREGEEDDVPARADAETITESGKSYIDLFVDGSIIRKRTGLNTDREVIRVDLGVLRPDATGKERNEFLDELINLARDFSSSGEK